MKVLKKVAAVLIFVLYSVSVFAQSVPDRIEGEKDENGSLINKDGSGVQQNVINFTGFPVEHYVPEDGVEVMQIVEKSIDIMAESWADNKEDYAIVGHSQGGLRALAYANVIKQKAKQETDPEMKAKYQHAYDHLGAVITVSGIDKGIKLLEGGIGNVRAKALEKVDVLWKGVDSFFHSGLALGLLWDCFKFISSCDNDLPNLNDKKEVAKLFIEWFGTTPELKHFLTLAIDGAGAEELKEIRDMTPFSDFITENVADIETETKKVKDGDTYLSLEWRTKKVGLLKIPYLVIVQKQDYKVYTEYKYTKLKMDEDIPVGYIVGGYNDLFASMDSGTLFAIDAVRVALGTAVGIHTLKTVGLIGLFTNSINYAHDAAEACDMLLKKEQVVNEFLGSDENDCFVARESQFYPKEAHPNVMMKNDDKYELFEEYNHRNINPVKNKYVQSKISLMLNEFTDVKTPVIEIKE